RNIPLENLRPRCRLLGTSAQVGVNVENDAQHRAGVTYECSQNGSGARNRDYPANSSFVTSMECSRMQLAISRDSGPAYMNTSGMMKIATHVSNVTTEIESKPREVQLPIHADS